MTLPVATSWISSSLGFRPSRSYCKIDETAWADIVTASCCPRYTAFEFIHMRRRMVARGQHVVQKHLHHRVKESDLCTPLHQSCSSFVTIWYPWPSQQLVSPCGRLGWYEADARSTRARLLPRAGAQRYNRYGYPIQYMQIILSRLFGDVALQLNLQSIL